MLTNCNSYNTLVEDVKNGEHYACVEAEGIWEISFSQFFCVTKKDSKKFSLSLSLSLYVCIYMCVCDNEN